MNCLELSLCVLGADMVLTWLGGLGAFPLQSLAPPRSSHDALYQGIETVAEAAYAPSGWGGKATIVRCHASKTCPFCLDGDGRCLDEEQAIPSMPNASLQEPIQPKNDVAVHLHRVGQGNAVCASAPSSWRPRKLGSAAEGNRLRGCTSRGKRACARAPSPHRIITQRRPHPDRGLFAAFLGFPRYGVGCAWFAKQGKCGAGGRLSMGDGVARHRPGLLGGGAVACATATSCWGDKRCVPAINTIRASGVPPARYQQTLLLLAPPKYPINLL